LTLAADGVLSGTPTAAGPSSFTVEATDSAGFPSTQNYTLTIDKGTPTLTWPNPADITYGTGLDGTQLDATASVVVNGSTVSVPGTFTYTLADGTTPAAGAVLRAGPNQTLLVSFTPTDAADFTSASGSRPINVDQATPTISWPAPADITYGTPLSATQLNATANVPGSFSYNVAPGTILGVGTQTLVVTFTPADQTDYRSVTLSVPLGVVPAVPTLQAVFLTDPPAQATPVLGPVVVFNDPVFFGRKAFRLRDRHGHNMRLHLQGFYLPTGQTVVLLSGSKGQLNWHDLVAGKCVLTINGQQIFDGFGRGPLGGIQKVRFFPLLSDPSALGPLAAALHRLLS
jgi:hypothetical protein